MRFQPENIESPKPAGLYIHVPFCVRKCPYCSFYSVADVSRVPAFVDALLTEIRLSQSTPFRFDSLYLGGGTPSLLTPQQIECVLKHTRRYFRFSKSVETTIEVNPGTLSPAYIGDLCMAGINRVNVGVQSFSDKNLRWLRRTHSVKDACRTLDQLRKNGFDNLGMDLIYGLPGQSIENWRSDLNRAIEYAPDHLSCYMLSYDAGTPFFRQHQDGKLPYPDQDMVRRLFEHTIQILADGGYEHYEISNFAKGQRFRSKHNQKYWFHHPYLGLGPSAHSFAEPRRWWNSPTLEGYLHALKANRPPIEGSEVLNSHQLMLESIFLGLRTAAGVDTALFGRRYHVNFETRFADLLHGLRSQGLVDTQTGRITLTTQGLILCDTVTALFAHELDLGEETT